MVDAGERGHAGRLGGAELVDPGAPLFWCNDCGMDDNEGNGRPITFPADRPAVEDALLKRPRRNQNWLPRETVADLLAENADAGLEA